MYKSLYVFTSTLAWTNQNICSVSLVQGRPSDINPIQLGRNNKEVPFVAVWWHSAAHIVEQSLGTTFSSYEDDDTEYLVHMI